MKKADVKKVLEEMIESHNANSEYAAEKWFLWHEVGINKDLNEGISSQCCARYSELRHHIISLTKVLGVKISEIDFQKKYVYPYDKNITGTLVYPIIEIEK